MEINKIIYFMSKLAEIKEINELVIHSSIITNGYLLNKEVFDKLMISNINTLQITIDGIGEKHDVHRHLANGGKTFDVIIKNHNIKIFIRNNNDAKSNLKEFIDYFYKFFKDDKRFIFDFHPIGDWKTTFSDIPKHQINNELYDYIKYAYALGLRVRSLEDDSMFAACLCQFNNRQP